MYYRIVRGKQVLAKVSGPYEESAEETIIRYAMAHRADGPVTIQRQQRSGGPNPDGKWYWKRHMMLEQWPPAPSPQKEGSES